MNMVRYKLKAYIDISENMGLLFLTARLTLKLNQIDFAKQLGVSITQLSRIENSKSHPSLKLLNDYMKLLSNPIINKN